MAINDLFEKDWDIGTNLYQAAIDLAAATNTVAGGL
jgi:hypothetical protein